MNGFPIRTLIIDDDPATVAPVQEAMAAVTGVRFETTVRSTLSEGLAMLAESSIDVVVLDLLLPDSQGLDALKCLLEEAPDVPVVVLTDLDDENTGVLAVRDGAQDYLVRTRVTPDLVVRSVRYAIERHRFLEGLRGMAMIDDLTGLYNRRGFRTLAEYQVKLAQRTNKQLLLIFADIDDFKKINDMYGHQEGDIALIETAEALRRTFRGSDVIARLGGDEFVILAIEPSGVRSEIVIGRLTANLRAATSTPGRPYRLSVSTGAARFDPWNSRSIIELIAQVDEAMYEEKRRRHQGE
ncbi:MAG: GGDEF domain-containing protein [Acidobacteriota bacterium]